MTPSDLSGYLLVAPPKVLDRRFNNTVIYIISHTPSGAWGLVTNKPIVGMSNKEVMNRLHIPLDLAGEVHAGGPVNNTSIHFIHTNEIVTDSTMFDDDTGICVSGDLSFITELANNVRPNKYRMYVGSCSWAPGQLEGEMRGEHPWSKEHSWLIAPASQEILFDLTGIEQWQAAVELSAQSAVRDWF